MSMPGLSGFEVQIAHSVEEIGQAAWDHLSRDEPFASYRWYRFGEAVLADTTPVYIILSQQGEPLARATFWLTREEPLPFSSRLVRQMLGGLLHRWPLLVCRSPWRSCTSGLILPAPPLRDAALMAIIQVAWDLARQHRVSFLAFDYLEDAEAEQLGASKAFVPVSATDPGTYLAITWPDFDSYLKHLSKSARSHYRRHSKFAAELGIQIKRYPAVTSVDQAMDLIRNVENHHDAAPDPWVRLALENATMVDATWLAAEIEGRLVGCQILLRDGEAYLHTGAGLDYSIQYAYFQLTYEAIRCAIDQGARLLQGGSGAYEFKRRLGFQLQRNNRTAFGANNGLLRWIGQRLSAA
jgi:predicted N-acyltransferase